MHTHIHTHTHTHTTAGILIDIAKSLPITLKRIAIFTFDSPNHEECYISFI